MIILNEDQVGAVEVTNPEAYKATMKVLVGKDEGWDDYVMRIFELQVGGYSPKHSHPWPHINYIVEGEGIILQNGKETPVKKGSFAFLPKNEVHQFRNIGKGIFRFICIVPKEGHK
jgi:quercetin dioxygenase-like cupin family protein